MPDETSLSDYTPEHNLIPILLGGVKTYACINSEMFLEDDALVPTGRYHVYLLHHTHGSCNFIMEPGESGNFEPEDAPVYVEQETIAIISNAIENRLM